MSELVPIAGVWYRSGTERANYVYAPLGDGDPTPWYSEDHERWIKQEELPDDLVECYNPHPATAAEWCASEENPSCLNYPDDDEEEARYIARNWEEASVWTRQVTGWKQMPNE